MRFLVLLVFAALCLTGCGGNTVRTDRSTNVNDLDITPLVGTWQLDHRSGGMGGSIPTPSGGYKTTLVFRSNGIQSVYENGQQTTTRPFWLRNEKTIFATEPQPVLVLSDSEKYTVRFGSNNTLTLSSNIYDGINDHYRRVAP